MLSYKKVITDRKNVKTMEGIATLWSQIIYAFSNIRIFDFLDILAIAFIIYKGFEFFKDTRAAQLIKGIFILLALFLVANIFNLITLKWLLLKVADSIIVVAVVVFQPELRRLLERVGRSNIGKIGQSQLFYEANVIEKCIGEVCKAVSVMQDKKIGALIVFERETSLGEIIATGTEIDAAASSELIQNIFYPKSPLHDGGMIIRNGRVAAAGCILPLTANNNINSQLGTRHRAAIGMSEGSDAIVVVVSEETGTISIAQNGSITRNYNVISLREDLLSFLQKEDKSNKSLTKSIKDWFSKFKKEDNN